MLEAQKAPNETIKKSYLQKAIESFEKALKIKQSTIGSNSHCYAITLDHLATARVISNEGRRYQTPINEVDKASLDKDFQTAIDIFLQTLGSTSSFLASTYNNSSSISLLRSKISDAKRVLRMAADTIESASKDHKGAWISEIDSIIKYNLNSVDSPFEGSKFKVARHDSFVGFTDKGFQVLHKCKITSYRSNSYPQKFRENWEMKKIFLKKLMSNMELMY